MDQHIGNGELPGLIKTDSNVLVANALNTAYIWAGIVCVIIIVIAGFMYVTSAGDASRLVKAKNTLFGAVIGIVVIMLAFAITNFVLGRF